MLDADAENAVRVIGFFDALVRRRADLDTLVRKASTLAECAVSVHMPGHGVWLRADPKGAILTSGRLPANAAVREFGDGTRVWLERPGAEPSGPDQLAVLRAFCTTDSVRTAAAVVYRHHSTVATRLAHAESVLGFPLDTSAGRFRLSLALFLRRLRDNR